MLRIIKLIILKLVITKLSNNNFDKIEEKISDLVTRLQINEKIFFQSAIIYEKYNLCKFLIKNIVSINDINEMFKINININNGTFETKNPIWEWTCPLIYFIKKQNIEIIKLLIENGANVNIRTHTDDTPLKIAIEKRNKEIVKLLIEKGANVNFKNKWGNIPLESAIVSKNKEIVQLLIDKGADLNLESYYGLPLKIAREKGNNEIVELLIKAGAKNK